MRLIKNKKFLLLIIILLGIFLRFYRLDEIPGEIFGDIARNLEHVNETLRGQWKIVYDIDGGREGMFYYLAALSSYIWGNTYLNLKILAALIGIGTVMASFLLAKEFANEEVGLITAFLVAVSKWPLVFSRVGFRAVLMPFFVALIFYFFLKAYKRGRTVDFIFTGLLTGLGFYTYTAFRLVPLAIFFIFVLLLFFKEEFIKRNKTKILLLTIYFSIALMPMVIDCLKQPEVYFAHSQRMLFQGEQKLRNNWLPALIKNVKNQLLMLHLKGDIVFRVNPTNQPQLDFISGLFFLLGIFLLLKRKRLLGFFLVVPLIVLQLPSILVLNVPIDVPSATRSIGIIPFVYTAVAFGIWWLFKNIKDKKLRISTLIIVLGLISYINFNNYFNRYTYGLPNRNTSIGKIIAGVIDDLPQKTGVYIVGCCWGEWGQPEPLGILFALKKINPIHFLRINSDTCLETRNEPRQIYIVPPPLEKHLDKIANCLGKTKIVKHQSSYGEVVFYSLEKL